MVTTTSRPRAVALMFPGQGAQHVRMAAGLYGWEEVFTSVLDRAFALLGPEGPAIRRDWLADGPPDLLDDATRAQPLLYAVDYALGRTVLSWGVRPVALLGHSVGELAAATLAGVLDFADGVRLIRDRVASCRLAPPGGMLAVAATPDEVAAHLGDGVAVAAVNAPRQLLLAGPAAPLAAAERALRAEGRACLPVRSRQPFHSPAMTAAAESSLEQWRLTRLRPPRRTVYSAYLGDVLTAAHACDPRFWARQPVDPVLFGPTLDRLLAAGDVLLVEAGPGRGLTALASRHRAVASGASAVVAMLPARPGGPDDDRDALRLAARRIAVEAQLAHEVVLPR
ncbi:acyltransferase domain-containing protein [Micromonospora cathayae]|uniref:Acyltransferase domain-containing protein n=1 Tax=Micromonospora cathayae TaxID=3028804 RepID=A0ABY7ZKQ4_9ACTN|nr:acyltransferase domain-containing protein [Micromonospora sp. HUAS 3]WDZ83569.1 acyltransferase domain-containing protein [Micromonospora sp. HUAS 3]